MSTYPYTVEQFEEAYKATGLRVITGSTYTMRRETGQVVCGCPQGALALHLAGGFKKGQRNYGMHWAMEVLKISFYQFDAFARGFDVGESQRNYCRSQCKQEVLDAFERGLECRKRFLLQDPAET